MAILLSCSGMYQASKCMYLLLMMMLEKMDGGAGVEEADDDDAGVGTGYAAVH